MVGVEVVEVEVEVEREGVGVVWGAGADVRCGVGPDGPR